MEASPDGAPGIDAAGDAIQPPPSCSGVFACVPAVPAGWSGPLELYSGTAPPPMCSTDFTEGMDAHDGLQAPAATCGCACGASATTCQPPKMTFSNAATCGSAVACAATVLTPGACMTLDETGQCPGATILDITLAAGTFTTGSCTAQPSRNVPSSTWGTQARGCISTASPEQADCGSGKICAPAPGTGFDAKLCISHSGDVLCPGGGYGVKHLFYTSVDDTRDCTACTCGNPTGGSCDFSVAAYPTQNQQCSGNPITYGPGTQCAGVDQPADFRLTLTPTDGSCAAGTSTATGTAVAAGPVTVCCPL